MALATDTKNVIDGVQYPAFRGSSGQCKWARSIRFKVIKYGLYTEPDQLDVLRRIDDATWWIANREELLIGRQYKFPASNQFVSPANPEVELPLSSQPVSEEDAKRVVRFSVVSARVFAKDVARFPKLAELAVLVMMARSTINPDLRDSLKKAAEVKYLEDEQDLLNQDKVSLATLRALLAQV